MSAKNSEQGSRKSLPPKPHLLTPDFGADDCKLLCLSDLKVVEAAGVEPASERPVTVGVYMRSRT